jgi:hypothetical protein
MTGLQQHGWQLDAQPHPFPQPSWFQLKRSCRSACAAVVNDNVATTTLQILIHFMTLQSPSLGIRVVGRLHPVGAGPANCLFVGVLPPAWFGGGGRPRRASRFPRSPDRGRAGSRRQNVFDHVGDAFVRHRFDMDSLSVSLFQSIREEAPSRSVCEGLEQSIGAVRTTA